MSARLKLDEVKCEVDALVTRAQVQLSQAGIPKVGVASERTTDTSWRQTVAEATLNAVRAFIGPQPGVVLDSVMEVNPGRYPLIVVTMTMGSGSDEVYLSGSASIVDDRHVAVAKAVLHALNRRLETILR